MSTLRPSRFRTPAAGGDDPSLEDAILGLSPTTTALKGSPAKKGKTKTANGADPAGSGIWRQKSATSLRVAAEAGTGAESRQCLSPRHISSRHLADGVNLDHPFDEPAHGGKQPTSLPSAVRSGLKLGNEIKSTDELEATFEEDDTTVAGAGEGEEARDDPDMLEKEESLAVSVDTYLDEVKAPKEDEEAAAAVGEILSKKAKKNSNSNKKKGKKGKKSKGKKGGKSKTIATAAAGGTAPSGLTAASVAGLDSEAPSDEEVDDAYFSLSKSLSGFSSVTGASDLDADADDAAAAVAATTPKHGTSTPISSQAALRLSLWRDRDTVILSATSPTKSRAATAATAAADVIVANQKQQKRVGAGGPESMRPRSQGELLLPSLCSHAASSIDQDEPAVDQASTTVSSIMARGTATPRGHKSSSSKYTFEAAANNDDASGIKKEVSFTQVRDAMRRFLASSPKADQGAPANDAAAAAAPSSSAAKEPLPSELQAAFWSKCAVLTATAVMATAKTANNRVQIAQAAAETVLSKCPKGEDASITDEDWRIAASEGMEDLAAEVSSAIIAVGSQGGNIPTVTTAAASAAAVVLLNQKEALENPTAESPIEDEAAVDDVAAPSVIEEAEAPQPVVLATPSAKPSSEEEAAAVDVAAPSVQETATEEELSDDAEKTPKSAVEEDMIESWRKEDNNDQSSELLSVGDEEVVVTPVPSLDSKAVDTEGESTPPAAAAAVAATAVATAAVATSDDEYVRECVKEFSSICPDVADKPTEGDVPTVEAEKTEASPPVSGEEDWINIDKALPESTDAPAEKDETLGSKIAHSVVTASAAAAATAVACCSPTKAAALSEKTDVESKSVLTPAVDIEVKPASAEAEPVVDVEVKPASAEAEPAAEEAAATSAEAEPAAEEAAATSDGVVLEVAQDTKEANATVEESAKERAVDAEPIKAAETSEAEEEVEIETTSQDEISVTTEPSSNAAKAVVLTDVSQAVAEEKPGEGEKEEPADNITPDAEDKESIDGTQLLEDLENKRKERNAKMDKQLSDFEAYLASIKSCASNEEDAVVTCNTSEEDGEKVVAAESEDIANIDAATEDEIASPEPESKPEPKPEPETASADVEAVIISSESEGETEVSLSGSDTDAKQNASADEPAIEAEKSADVENEITTMEDKTSTLKSNGSEDQKAIGKEKTVKSVICDTLEGHLETCADNFSSAAKEAFQSFTATVVASCMPTPDVTDNGKSKDSAEEETQETTEDEKADGDEACKMEDDDADGDDSKELAEEIEVPIDVVATKEESEETIEQPAAEEQVEFKPESADEVDIPTAASTDCAVGEKLAETDESSAESAKEEDTKEDYSSVVFCPLIKVDEAAQLPVATEAAIDAEANAAQSTPAKKATTGKKRFSSVKKIFKKKSKKYEL